MNPSAKRLRIAALLLGSVVCLGSFGFMWIEGYPLLEAIYMTVITVSTVGFGEVRSLSDGGMLFTAILIVSSIGTFTFAATAVTQFFIEGDYRERLRAKRIQRIMNEMNNHVIICGHGRVGEKAVQELQDHAHEVVIIESNEELVKKLRDAGVRVLSGDATEDENLVNAGLDRARIDYHVTGRRTKPLRGPRRKRTPSRPADHQSGVQFQCREQVEGGRCPERHHARPGRWVRTWPHSSPFPMSWNSWITFASKVQMP